MLFPASAASTITAAVCECFSQLLQLRPLQLLFSPYDLLLSPVCIVLQVQTSARGWLQLVRFHAGVLAREFLKTDVSW
uniref:Secreted protein n=1 Tax=Angiostrongylus cantonensis TaxID=6313 RepID=A0A0K0DAR8_ANGCA